MYAINFSKIYFRMYIDTLSICKYKFQELNAGTLLIVKIIKRTIDISNYLMNNNKKINKLN